MISYLFAGILFGFAAGTSPGPLLVVLINETLKHGKTNGIKVALVPLIADIPIVLITLYATSLFQHFENMTGFISIAGALYLMFLGYEYISAKDFEPNLAIAKPRSFQKGIITNALNPHPYIFWLTIGCPLIIKASVAGIIAPAIFLIGFYFALVGSKIVIAILIGTSDNIFHRYYVIVNKILGVALIIFAILFLKEGLNKLGVW